MAWQFQHTAESSARPAEVWRYYADVTKWPEWSRKGVKWAELDGPFETGTTGKSKPPGLPAGKFRLVDVVPEKKFVTESRFPGSRLVFVHRIEPTVDGVRITHHGETSGPLAFVLTAIIRRMTERALPDGVDRLARMAEAGAPAGLRGSDEGGSQPPEAG